MAKAKKEAQFPVNIEQEYRDGTEFFLRAPDKHYPANALLTQKQLDFIRKAEELMEQAQEILELAYYGKTREERILEEIKARAAKEARLMAKGEKLKL